MSIGPDALRAPAGPLPADPADDADLPAELAGAQGRGRAPPHRVGDHRPRPRVVVALRRVRVVLDRARATTHTHDAQIGFFACGYNADIWRGCLRDRPGRVLRRPDSAAWTRRRERDRAGQSRATPQRGRDRPGQRGPADASRHPHELLRRPARHGGHGRRHAPGPRHRRALAGAAGASARCSSRRRSPPARPRRRRPNRATRCSRTWPATTR